MNRHSLLVRLDMRDRELFLQWVAADASALARAFWRGITHAGGPLITIGVVLATLLADDAPMRAVGLQAALALLGTHLTAQILKRIISRPRPSSLSFEALIAVPTCFSFPSGHAIAASSLAFVYAWHFSWLAPALLLVAALVGVSRVRLGVHYPGDVLAGQVVALLGASTVVAFS